MSDEPHTTEEVERETRALLGDDAGDLAYITDDLVASDAKLAKSGDFAANQSLGNVCFGMWPRWGRVRIDGVSHSVVLLDCGREPANPDHACFPVQTVWLDPNRWRRHLLGTCRGDVRRPQYRFDLKDG